MNETNFRFVGLWLLLIVTLLVNCDPFKQDAIPDGKIVTVDALARDYYVLENSSAIICKTALVKSSFTKISVDVGRHPRQGTISAVGDLFLKYTPSLQLREKLHDYYLVTDEFELAFKDNEDVLARERITIHLSWRSDYFPCSLYAMGDTASTTVGIPVSIRPTFNDRICNIRMEDVSTSISLEPSNGKAVVHGDTIIYTPDTGFYGSDEMIYRISTPVQLHPPTGDKSLISYGLVEITIRE